MASTPEIRGNSGRITWLLGGRRGAAKQSCTFSGGTEKNRMKTALAAKALVESRGHDITRDEVYEIICAAPVRRDSVPTFAQWAEEWIETRRRARDAQPNVLDQYERCLKVRTVPYLGHKRLTDINRDAIRGWVQWMSGSHITYGNKNRRTGDRRLSAATIGKHFMVTSACLAAAVPKWIEVNPAAPLPGERKNSVGLPSVSRFEGLFLSGDEVDAILAHCPPRLYDLVYVALRTGMRMGELLALEVQHVGFGRGGGATVWVRQALKADGSIGDPKSKASRRDIPVSGEAAEILRRLTERRRASAVVFLTERGRRWHPQTLLQKHWYRAVAEAQRCAEHPPPAPVRGRSGPVRLLRPDEVSACGCPGLLLRRPRFHDLRHTHASALIASGMHVKKVQRRLGHANFQTTMDVYGHLIDLGGVDELAAVESFLSASPVRVAG